MSDDECPHRWMVSPRSGKTILCIVCGRRRRNHTKFAKSIRFVSLTQARVYWKKQRAIRNREAEDELWFYL